MSDISESEVHEALSVLQKWRDQGGDLNFSSTEFIRRIRGRQVFGLRLS